LLLLFYGGVLALRTVVRALDRNGAWRMALDRGLAALVAWRLAPVALAAPLAAALYFTPWWQMWGGIPTPIMGFVPNGPAVVGFGTALAFGWFLHRQQALLQRLARDWRAYLGGAVILSVAALWLVGPRPVFRVVEPPAGERLLYTVAYTLAIWTWVLGIVGFAADKLAAASARWRYLSDASFWMYLVHVPVVWGLQAWMMRWPLHWSVKFPLILAITMLVLLGSYHYLVRSTFVGKLLNGRKYPRNAPVISASNISPG
jgi:peptidoglycan/LPS O-acetylase OafA/YrhL